MSRDGKTNKAASQLFDQPLVFVDIETNGLDHVRGKIIEIAAIRVEQGIVVDEFHTLVDPETPLPTFITNLTGITSADVHQAPVFAAIADRLEQILAHAVFVAHNVRFDYAFIKQELKAVGRSFSPKLLCTVRLSRALYPEVKGHSLGQLIARHQIPVTARHRAYDDARVLWDFLQIIARTFEPGVIDAAVRRQLKQPSLPKTLDPKQISSLPETAGVYIFEDESGAALYVGKSINIKKRVMSHFSRDHADPKEFKIASGVHGVKTIQTAGELGALLKESELIKELQPLYNRRLRRSSLLCLVVQATNQHGYQVLTLQDKKTIELTDLKHLIAVYPTRTSAKSALMAMQKTYDLCPKLMGLEKATGRCFSSQLGKCRGACQAREAPAVYNNRLSIAFERTRVQRWPYRGPIIISEENHETHAWEGYIVDQWCVLGALTQQPDCEPLVETTSGLFDIDTYKILSMFLQTKKRVLQIKPISTTDLQAFAAL